MNVVGRTTWIEVGDIKLLSRVEIILVGDIFWWEYCGRCCFDGGCWCGEVGAL